MNDINDNSPDAVAARHAAFHDLVAKLEGQKGAQPSQAQTVQPSAPSQASQPNASDLAFVRKMHGYKDDSGARKYDTDPNYRQRIERLYQDVAAGRSISGVRSATERSLAGQPPAEPAREIAEPQGTPAERAAERLEANEYIEPHETTPENFREIAGGYSIADLVPAGFGIGPVESEMLRAAKAAGIEERQIRAAVANIVRAQQ